MPTENHYMIYIVDLLKLRTIPAYLSTFTTGTITYNLSGPFKWMEVYDNSLKVVVIGNFDVVSQTGSVTFPSAGTWYDYINGTPITATGGAQSFTLQPGEYHVYLNTNLVLPVTLVSFTGKNNGGGNMLSWTVANEKGIDYYGLERSTDGQNFSGVSSVVASGKSGYSFSDNLNLTGYSFYYYRLKIVDKDGNFKYSSVVKIKMPVEGEICKSKSQSFLGKTAYKY